MTEKRRGRPKGSTMPSEMKLVRISLPLKRETLKFMDSFGKCRRSVLEMLIKNYIKNNK
jgi:hypothetical protein